MSEPIDLDALTLAERLEMAENVLRTLRPYVELGHSYVVAHNGFAVVLDPAHVELFRDV